MTSITLPIKLMSLLRIGGRADVLVKKHADIFNLFSLEAEYFSEAIRNDKISWKIILAIKRTNTDVTIFPVNIPTLEFSKNSPHLDFYT